MSLFRHIIVLFFIFATYYAKLEDDPDVIPPSTTKPDAAKFSFNGTSGPYTLKISMEKVECTKTKTETCQSMKSLTNPEEEKKPLGTKDNAAKSCNDVEDSGEYYIKNYITSDQEAFKVKCDLVNKKTCLIINSKIDASSIDSTAITKGDHIWLSQTGFDVKLLYNKIEEITGTNRAQISYLLSTSIAVNQKIKYYYSNGILTETKDNNVASLEALLWNDHLVSSKVTKQLPMQFTFNATEQCWDGNSRWVCSDILFEDNSNKRLPVTDFYIEAVQAKPDVLQKLYFDLVELCFSYD